MGQALYRSHRPKKLSEVVGQEHVTTALERALGKSTISHAYLFTGPRGTGKTSIARILAHEINSLPYDDSATHLDIIEIDAASNRRIDEIRELRDKVHVAPSSAKYKVYIIDEVHMLTKEAFNALLKTLEEPPAHVVFILATTEVHKLPETIISRTQRYAFRPVDLAKVVAHLQSIADKEGIAIDKQALELIAQHGEGSFRDSISLLDQVRNNSDKVTLSDVQACLGIAPKDVVDSLIKAVAAHDAPQTVKLLQGAHAAGHEPARMAKQLGETLRQQLISSNTMLSGDQILELLAKLIEVPSSGNPRANLEVALLDVALAGSPATIAPSKPAKPMQQVVEAKPAVQVDPHPELARKRAAAKPAQTLEDNTSRTASTAPAAAAPVQTTQEKDEPSASLSSDTLDPATWPDILAAIKQRYNTLFGIIKTTRPTFEPGVVTLECAYAFHQKKLNEQASKDKLSNLIKEVTGHDLQIRSVVGNALKPDEMQQLPPALPPSDEKVHTVAAPAAPQTPQTPDVAAISNIFGGAEILES